MDRDGTKNLWRRRHNYRGEAEFIVVEKRRESRQGKEETIVERIGDASRRPSRNDASWTGVKPWGEEEAVWCVCGVCQYHVQCYHSEACMAGVGNDVTQYLGVSLVWNTTLHRLYFRRTTPCIKSFLQSGTQWASLPFGLTILPVNWPGSFVSNSNRVGIFF